MRVKLFIMMAAVLLLASCEKERGGLYQGGEVGASGKKLVKISYHEYEVHNEYTDGNFEWMRFAWSGNQLNGIFEGGYEHGSPIEYSDGWQYVYTGDNLTELQFSDGGFQINDYLTYSGGHLTEIYRTVIDGGYSEWSRSTMTYSSDGHLQEMTVVDNEGDNRKYQMTWSGENIAAVQYYSNGVLGYTVNFTYDNKKSAYSEMPEWYAFYADGFGVFSANNVILENWNYADGDSYSYSYVYAYDGDYPVKRMEGGGDYSSYSTTYFEYADGTKAQIPTIYSLDVSEGNSSDGYTIGGGEYAAGSTAKIYAEAMRGVFQSWSDGNTQNPRTITVNGNASYTAIFSNGSNGGGSGNNGTYRITFNGTSWDAAATLFFDHTSEGYITVYAYKNSADEGSTIPSNDAMVYGWLESSTGSYTFSSTYDFMYYRDPHQTFTLNSTRVLSNGDTIQAGTYYRYQPIESTFSETITAIDLNAHTISATWTENLFDLEVYINNNGTSYGTQYTLSGTLSNYHFTMSNSKSASSQATVSGTSAGTRHTDRTHHLFNHHRNKTEKNKIQIHFK